ncbi:MAG TPA: septal ring lytic transglycosylase RlpA family protein [Paucimonas sp.]|nr:septal ring lytic transglycosylase RlpA family protein [Paucimonas sp.]
MRLRMYWPGCLLAAVLAGCGTVGTVIKTPPPASVQPAPPASPATAAKSPISDLPVLPPAGSGRGGYYQDDGPGDNPPAGLMEVPDAVPKIEPYLPRASRPYTVFGKTYTPITDDRPFKQRGVGSWYGKKFHGQKTSSGELYDMYKMTAAHPTLPLPSYARVTNLNNGKQIVVRVNDRGPFHSGRIIDLSYTAALKLGYLGRGSGQLEVERILPDEIERIASRKNVKQDEQPLSARSNTPSAQNAPSIQHAPAPLLTIDDAIARGEQSAPAAAEALAVEAPVALTMTPSLSIETPVVPARSEAAAPAQAPVAGGFYLQLGAFSQASNAQAVRGQLQRKWASDLPPIEVVENGLLYRLYSGPFATRADAASAAQQLLDAGIPKPLIVQR